MGVISLFIIIATVLFSWQGFRNRSFYENYLFNVDKILIEKDYKRLVTSGFLHVNWMHLIVNMFSLYAFSESVEIYLGVGQYLIIFFASLLGGNLLSLFIHRHHGDYRSVGASGAVCGIIFAAIAIFPGMKIGIFPFPFSIPAWIYGLIYVLYSIFGIRSRFNDTGHDAHLGGALVGMMIAILMVPSSLSTNLLPILAVTIPSLVFMYILAVKPHLFMSNKNIFDKKKDFLSIEHRYNAEKLEIQKEVDRILDKIGRKGMNSLTQKEKAILKEYSKAVK